MTTKCLPLLLYEPMQQTTLPCPAGTNKDELDEVIVHRSQSHFLLVLCVGGVSCMWRARRTGLAGQGGQGVDAEGRVGRCGGVGACSRHCND